MKRPSKALVTASALSVLLSGCAVSGPGVAPDGTIRTSQAQACQYDYAASAGMGAAGGALAGSLIGRANRGQNALIGAAAGAMFALLLTSYLEKRCKALDAARRQMRAAQLDIASVKVAAPSAQAEEGVQVTANDPGMFAEGSAQLSDQGLHDMQVLAQSFAGTDRRVLIVGHTDTTGTTDGNQRLSEERARTVARLFAQAGIPAARIYYKGAGETRPIDSNDTAQGRSRNRRVEVLELQSESGILAFDDMQDADPALLPHAVHPRAVVQASVAPPKPQPSRPDARVAAGKPPAKPAPRLAAAPARPAPGLLYRADFGGTPVDGNGAPLAAYVGADRKVADGLSFIPAAFAAEPANAALLDTACIADNFRQRGVVKSLATGEPVGHVSDHAKGLYGKSWSDTVNGNLVGLTNVSVLRGTGQVDTPPQLLVFAGYKPGDQKPSFTAKGEAQAYIGEKGLLYRVFYRDETQPVRCMDIVFSHTNVESLYGRLYYQKDGRIFVAVFHPAARTGT